MHVITAVGINDAIDKGIRYLLNNGETESSRNGSVLVAPFPVTTVYTNPKKRVAFSRTRNANPFFHLMEALWMICGHNDIHWPAKFNKRFYEYSDNGETQWGAYGWRWRRFFGFDQIQAVIEELKTNPNSRRAVISMWNAYTTRIAEHINDPGCLGLQPDLGVAKLGGRDVPCNTHIYFDLRHGVLNMTVCCRSNDIIWGAYGANIVHFSMLQEYMAILLEVPIGIYRQVSNNFHVYTDVYDIPKLEAIAAESRMSAIHYEFNCNDIPHTPLNEACTDIKFRSDFVSMQEGGVCTVPFLREIAQPMFKAWIAYKNKDTYDAVLKELENAAVSDWTVAARRWLERAYKKGEQHEFKF